MSTSARPSFAELCFALSLAAVAGCAGSEPEAAPVTESAEEAIVEGTPVAPAEPSPAGEEGAADPAEVGQVPATNAGSVRAPGSLVPPGTAAPTLPTERDQLSDLAALVSAFEGPAPTRAELDKVSKDPGAGLITLTRDAGRTMAVRAGATRALGVVGGAGPMARLDQLLAGDDAVLRRAAVQGADPHLDQDAALRGKIVGLMSDPDPGVARAAVLALGDVPSARAAIQALAASELPPPVRTAVNEVLGVGGSPKPGGATPLTTPTRDGSRGSGR